MSPCLEGITKKIFNSSSFFQLWNKLKHKVFCLSFLYSSTVHMKMTKKTSIDPLTNTVAQQNSANQKKAKIILCEKSENQNSLLIRGS